VSTGVGPVGFYTSVGGGRRGGSASTANYQRQLAAQQRQAAHVQRIDEARALADTFLRILNLHHAGFAPATPPVVPPPEPPDRARIYLHYETMALAGIGLFRLAERKQARQRATVWTEAEVKRQWAASCEQQAQWQRHYDHRWQQLCANEPDIVMETLNEAFEDNQAPSAAVGVDRDDVSLVILLPARDEVVPERMPTTTPAGNLSLRKLPQRERSDYYKVFVSGQVLVTVRETFAVAPGLGSASVVVLRNDGRDAYGQRSVSCIMAVKFVRTALNGVQWDSASATQIVNDASAQLLISQRGRSNELSPLDLMSEPALSALVQTVDPDDVASD